MDDLYRDVNRVAPSLIRVEADEVTYNLHIMIRFELELALMAGDLDVDELPAAWNDAYERRLGVRPQNDVVGVLQDTHWSEGAFGYFPTYSLGNLYSAMLWRALAARPPGRRRADRRRPLRRRCWAGCASASTRRGSLEECEPMMRRVTGLELESRAAHGLPVGQVRRALRRGPGDCVSEILELFLELAAIASPPGRERAVADRVGAFLDGLGLAYDEDAAGAAIGSEIGNLYCRLPATAPGTPFFLNAHLDTVPPTAAVEPEVRNGVVVNSQDTILGADNKAAVASMLAAVAAVVREGRPHPGIELVLTPMEEVGLRGAKQFDTGRLVARHGYCYDHAAPIGQVVLAAPTQKSHELRLPRPRRPLGDRAGGRAKRDPGGGAGDRRHAAGPDRPRDDRQRRPDRGRRRRQHRPARVPGLGGGPQPRPGAGAGARPGDAGRGRARGQHVRVHARERDRLRVRGLSVHAVAPSRPAGCNGARGGGYGVTYIESGGGADANVFNLAGVPCVNLCNGAAEIHTPSEHITVDDLEGMTRVTLALVAAALET